MDTIINFFSVKGIIDSEMLFEPPFTDINTSGVMGVFDEEETRKVISIIERVNGTCMVG
jgi:type I restriction enzyme R subunit